MVVIATWSTPGRFDTSTFCSCPRQTLWVCVEGAEAGREEIIVEPPHIAGRLPCRNRIERDHQRDAHPRFLQALGDIDHGSAAKGMADQHDGADLTGPTPLDRFGSGRTPR